MARTPSPSRSPDLIGVVVLAAGASSRLGLPKQLLEVGGETLIRRAARAARAAGDRVVVVLGAYEGRMTGELAGLDVTVVRNGRWAEGMASSIRAGLEALRRGPAPAAVLVTLCDQPLVGEEALQRIVRAYREGGHLLVASAYGGGVGVPALFSGALLGELAELDGHGGAKPLLARHAGEVLAIACPEAELDVDTPGDARRLLGLDG